MSLGMASLHWRDLRNDILSVVAIVGKRSPWFGGVGMASFRWRSTRHDILSVVAIVGKRSPWLQDGWDCFIPLRSIRNDWIVVMVSTGERSPWFQDDWDCFVSLALHSQWLFLCRCDRREAIATLSEIVEMALFHCVPFAMTDLEMILILLIG